MHGLKWMRSRDCLFSAMLALAALLAGCGSSPEPGSDGGDPPRDGGMDAGDPPVDACVAEETSCDGADEDCDGTVDEGLLATLYRDADGDGVGEPTTSREGCPGEDGWALSDADCDDACETCYPGSDEVCDSRDNDCDEEIDERGADGPCYCYEATHAGHDYLFCRGAYTRPEALEHCRDNGFELTSIESQDEHDWIWETAGDTGDPQDWWIGLEDRETEGTYVWSDGTPLGSYTNWNPGQPDNGGEVSDNEDCAELNEPVGGRWNDLGCEMDYLSFICETTE
jgi:hypothetical protein